MKTRVFAVVSMAACLAGAAFGSEKVAPERIDAIVAEHAQGDAAGCVVAVIRDGERLYSKAVGLSRVGESTPLTARTRFYVASMAKQFTAASVVHLAAAGKVSLDDDVRKRFPELPSYGKPITIRDLLHHRSGIRDFFELMALAGLDLDVHRDPKEIVSLIARQKELCFEPGSRFLYSNSGYFLLGELIRRVTEKSLAAYARENLFEPLGMKDTLFLDDSSRDVPNRATGHEWTGSSLAPKITKFDLVGSGGMWTTLDDLALWDRNFTSKKWGGESLVASLFAPPSLAADRTWNPVFGPYACGLMVHQKRGHRVVRHGGDALGFRSEYLRYPDDRLSVFCLSNATTVDAHVIAERIAEAYLPDLKSDESTSQASAAVPPEAIRPLLGPYRDPRTHRVWVIGAKGDAFRAVALGTPPMIARASAADRLESVGTVLPAEFRFAAGSGDTSRTLTVTIDGKPDGAFEQAAITMKSKEDELARVAGEYAAPELSATLTLAPVDGRLAIVAPRLPFASSTFVAIGNDTWICDGGLQLDFTRDASGAVVGARISTNRAWNVQLLRK